MTKHLLLLFASITVLTTCSSLWATPPEPKGDAKVWDDYWRGLAAMREEKWNDAITPLSQAVVACAPGDGRLLLARGVAYALVSDFDLAAASGDLQRARKLNPADACGTAYLAAAKADMGQYKKSEASYRVAIALEQARLLFDEQDMAHSWPRDAGELALSMRVCHLLASTANSAG